MMTNLPGAEHLFAGLEDDREAAAPYLSIFIDEARSTLDELVDALLALETTGGQKAIEQLFVAAHRMKGSAASIGLNRAAKISHLMEDLLQILVDEGQQLTPQMTDAMLACTDGLRQYVDAIENGVTIDDRFATLAQQLLAAGEGLENAAPTAAAASSESAAVSPTAEPTPETPDAEALQKLRARLIGVIPAERRNDALIGRVNFEPDLPLVGLKAQLIYSKLMNLGEVRHLTPPPTALENLDSIDAMEFCVLTEKNQELVQRMLQVAGVRTIAIEPLEPLDKRQLRETIETAEAAGPAAEHAAKPAETLRVDIGRLDQLMNLAGQLTIGKARITQIGEQLKKAASEKDDAAVRDSIGDLFEAIHLLDRTSDGIQQGVMNMRMLPIGPLFNRFHRVVRDLTRANGKEIRLEIHGETTELDKRMIDELGDPMIHMVRNAADHGIESPDERLAADKPRCGTISLCAFHRGSNIIIQVSDDGRGLDAARIREKAVERGLISAADAERMTPREAFQWIFSPGLSTAEQITEVSGRGVGMDIVRSKVEELNGSIDIDSEPGRGTTLTVKLPLTLAILPSLMVEIDGDMFAIPLESIVEIVSVARRDTNTVQGLRMATVRDHIVPIMKLDAILCWRQKAKDPYNEESNSVTLVIFSEGNQQFGLAVHRVFGEEDIVIKSIADNYRNVAGIAGASVLGDGRVSLILDPHALIELSSRPGAAAATIRENHP